MKEKKNIFIILLFCVAIGVIYAIYNAFPQKQARVLIIGVAVCVVIVWMVVKMVNMVRLNKIVSEPVHFLYEDKRPDLYVEEMKKVLEKIHSRQQKDLIRINIAAGQVYNGDFEEALATIDQVALPGQPVVNQVLAYANQAMAYLCLNRKEEVLKLVEEQRFLFQKYEHTASGLTNNIMVTYAIEQYAKGEYNKALEYLDRLKDKKVSSILQDVVDYLYFECYRNLKREVERAELKRMMLASNLVPGIRKKLDHTV